MNDDSNDPAAKPITWKDIERLKVDSKGRLVWDGNLVQVQRALTLTRWQTVSGVLITFGALAQGIFAAYSLWHSVRGH